MPKGLYYTPVVFSLSNPEVTEQMSTKLGHIFLYDCYLKILVRTPLGIYPPPTGWGAKPAFWDRL